EVAVLVVAEQQGSEMGARALRVGVAADDELLIQDALELEPRLRAAAGLVGSVRSLGDEPFPSLPARLLVGLLALPDDVVGGPDGSTAGTAGDRCQDRPQQRGALALRSS